MDIKCGTRTYIFSESGNIILGHIAVIASVMGKDVTPGFVVLFSCLFYMKIDFGKIQM